MPIQFNHTIIHSTDRSRSARFLANILGRPAPVRAGPFDVVQLDNGVSLDFSTSAEPIRSQHYAFLIDDEMFDDVLARVRALGLVFWADPWRRLPGEINRNDGGRGVYFPDPDGHYLEVITKHYGGAG